MRVAIVHFWLTGMRGGEKVIEALCRLYPEAVIFTHVYRPDQISARIRQHEVRTSFINALPRPERFYKAYLPLMPLALEQLDLREFDLVISSESGPAKGVIVAPHALHVCYCHSPMRYIWNMYHDYLEHRGLLSRVAIPPLAHYLRTWDASVASRVDHFIANSGNVSRRILKYYRRDSSVIPPPVDLRAFKPVSLGEVEDYYLMVGELVRYKRPDLAVQAFNKSGRRLVVIGRGEMLKEIQALAGPTVEVLGSQPLDVLQHHYARCRALVFPGDEDFGIVPLEAMASGRPVVAFRRGGALETVIDGRTGVFFDEQRIESLLDGIDRLEGMSFDSAAIRHHAARFSEDVFIDRFRDEITRLQAGALDAAQ